MRELESHNLTLLQAEEIADLIRSRGFEENEEINFFHKGFVRTEEHFAAAKEKMTKEEHSEMMGEMKEMLEYARGLDGVNDDVKIDDRTETLMAAQSAYMKIEKAKAEAARLRAMEGISMNDAIDLMNYKTQKEKVSAYKSLLGIQDPSNEAFDELFSEEEANRGYSPGNEPKLDPMEESSE